MTVQGMLKEATGLVVPRSAVERAIRERMEAIGQPDRKQYAYDLSHGATPGELAQLVELVVVPESWLFRDPRAFALAVEFVKVRLARGARLVRILSLPCAAGEEPYSMAMALSDAGVPLSSFVIDAVDISAACVARASRGVFGRNAFRAQDLSFRERYFTPLEGSDDSWRIDAALQQRVRFSQGNILAEAPTPSAAYDIIFCRNLLIYFDRPTTKAAAARLSALLADDGILMAGYAEVPAFTQNGFVPLPHRYAFALRKALDAPGESPAWSALPGAAPAPRPAAYRSATAPAAPGPTADAAPATRRVSSVGSAAAHRAPSPASAPGAGAGHAPSARITAAPRGGHAASTPAAAPLAGRASAPARQAPREPSAPANEALLAIARRLADQGKTKEAAAACRNLLQQTPENAEAWFILALLAEAEQQPEDAEQHLKRCIYLQPDHYEALCHLALLAEQGGNRSAAATLKARAARAWERQQASR